MLSVAPYTKSFLKHLLYKQFHKIVKGDSTFLGNLRNLQNIIGLNRLSK